MGAGKGLVDGGLSFTWPSEFTGILCPRGGVFCASPVVGISLNGEVAQASVSGVGSGHSGEGLCLHMELPPWS